MEKEIINLSLEVLIRECLIDRSRTNTIKVRSFFEKQNDNNIHEVFKYRKFNYDFIDYLALYPDNSIKPSYKEFGISLCNILNLRVNKKIETEEDLTTLLNERLKELSNIKTKEELFDKFPYIYRDYIDGINYLEKMEKNNSKEEEKYFYKCCLRRNFKSFIEKQVELYSRFITRRNDYKNLIEKNNFNDYIKDNFDMNKVNLYVQYEILKQAINTKDNDRKRNILNRVDIDSIKDNISIKTERNSITNKDVLKGIYEKEKNKVLSLYKNVNWEIIPDGKEYQSVKIDKNTKVKRTLMNQEEIDRLTQIGNKKNKFYDQTMPLIRVKGLKDYQGYIGYIYKNGEVILDKFFESSKPYTAIGDAIYNLRIENFDKLTKLDKKALKNNPNVNRIVHSKNWQKRVNKIINKEPTEEERIKAEEIIKKYTKKKNNY